MLNDWGYMDYANPYYNPTTIVIQQPLVYDYSQPLSSTSTAPAQPAIDQASSAFDQARSAFKSGNYASALDLTDQALRLVPSDPSLHEFRSLILFAMQRYEDAAVPLYTVLAAGPGWDWPSLVGLYPNVDVYTSQLRALEDSIRSGHGTAATRFLLAYHYLVQGHVEAAIAQLKDVTRMQPSDKVSAMLLRMLQSPSGGVPTGGAPAPAPNAAPPGAPAQGNGGVLAPAPAREGNLTGTWTAHPSAETSITLGLTDAGHFSWKVTHQGKTQEFQGDRIYGNGLLTLAQTGQEGQPPMVGRVIWTDDDHFTFKVMAGPADDAGLAFSRTP
jgi:tetratricopeptide (TPR) repeat protein